MSNDAKLGLVLGVALVVLIALVFFRSDPVEANNSPDAARLAPAVQNGVTPPTLIPSSAP